MGAVARISKAGKFEANLELGQVVILGGHFKGEALHHGLLNLAYIGEGILLR